MKKCIRTLFEAPGKAFDLAYSRASYALFAAFMACCGVFAAAFPAAAADLTEISKGMDKLVGGFGPMLKKVFALGGFFLVGVGLWQLYQKSQQPGQPKGGAIMAIFIGAAMIAAVTLAKLIGGTLGTGDGTIVTGG